MNFELRPAQPDDAPTIHALITGLAVYEREPDAVEVTVDTLRQQLALAHPPFECLLAERTDDTEPRDGAQASREALGFALFFQSYSTWRGKPGLYLEDLFVIPEARGAGIGKALLRRLAAIAVERDYGRMEWAVLNWNQPAIDFYQSLGASPLDEWTTYRLTGDALLALGAK